MPNLPLDTMSVEEKLQAMETLWDDLCRHDANVPSPAWHGEVLAERDAALARGEETPVDWEVAKASSPLTGFLTEG
ncbi:MAG: addiction module protein [Candidatus Hydrogenedentota bacterium]